jgi:hypothetical protein
MYSTNIGIWKEIKNKHTGTHLVPVDTMAKWSARNQFSEWLLSEVDDVMSTNYLDAAKTVKYSYELNVARLAIDLVNCTDALSNDMLVNKALRKQLNERNINHRKLSQWRIVSAVLLAEYITGITITSEVLRKDPPVIVNH